MSHLARIAAAISVIAVLGAAVTATSAWADEIKKCRADPLTGQQTCVIMLQPSPPLTVLVGARSGQGAQLPLRWVRMVWTPGVGTDASQPGCVRQNGITTEIGVVYVVILVNDETSEQLLLTSYCVFPGDPLPQPPPPPPSASEFRSAAAELLKVESLLNPRSTIGGLTGLETWLWCVDPGVVSVGVDLRGWSASAQMSSVQHAWNVSGPSSRHFTANRCGAESSPAASWMPETMGEYQVTLATRWAGTWTLSWNGIPVGTFALGPFDFASTPVAYPVDEYRGVLTDGTR